MESQLAEFRERKKRELRQQSHKNFTTVNRKSTSSPLNIFYRWSKYISSKPFFVLLSLRLSELPVIGWPFCLKLILWFILLGLSIEMQFGAVYCMLSAFVLLYIGTSTRSRKKNEKSAYSVFNKNCEKLDGTFTAEQFDKQLRSGRI